MRAELEPRRADLDDASRDVLVLDADSSQQEAIEAVRSGSHLVVHGPPGTGKSQTIANLIATLAADGRRVLFVAEKRAAIDAVVGRLERVGLGDLVLDLHAGAHGRRRVARELVDGLDRIADTGALPTRGVPAPADVSRVVSADAVRRATAEQLAGHVGALHERREPWGVSLYDVQEAVSAFAALPTPPRSRVRLHGEALAALDREGTAAAAAAVTTVASLADWDGAGASDPWFGAGIRTPEEAAEARERVQRLAAGGVDGTARTLAEVFVGIHLPEAPTTKDWGNVLTTVGEVRDTLEVFRPDVFDIPLDDLVTATGSSAYRRSVGSELGWLDRWRLRRQARALLRPGRPPADLHAALAAASEQRVVWRDLAGSGGRPEIPVELDRARVAHGALVDDLAWLDDRLPPPDGAEPAEDLSGSRLVDLDLASLRTRVDELAAATGRLAAAAPVRAALDGLTASGLRPLVDDLRSRAVPAERAMSEVEWVWWSSLADEISLRDPRVAAHDGRALTHAATQFVEADRAVVAANPARVVAAVADRVAEVVHDHPEQETFLRAEGARARRPAPLRDLVVRCPELVTAVRPCWVMSPLVVASVLPPGRWFDVVVFDEASQVPPAEAVSAISRARQVVVAGDSRQLPPTSFFTTVTDGDPRAAATDEAITEGVESILDVLAAALPSRRLSWHYRSLDERLIAFANAEVYEGTLVTFPGTGTDAVVHHELVEGQGVVTEGESAVETTTAEVERVVELVLEHARDRPERSLGVIALGITHATRVEGALRRALAGADDRVLAFFDEERAEAFFVKNLERVQGDERDDVILTVGYGKTPHGRVLHRFGPLNLEGGERRLNVAITRARRSMTVVSSIAADDLDPTRLRARGARMLRDFLAYAAGVVCPPPSPTPRRMPSAHLLRSGPSCSPTWRAGCGGTASWCTRGWARPRTRSTSRSRTRTTEVACCSRSRVTVRGTRRCAPSATGTACAASSWGAWGGGTCASGRPTSSGTRPATSPASSTPPACERPRVTEEPPGREDADMAPPRTPPASAPCFAGGHQPGGGRQPRGRRSPGRAGRGREPARPLAARAATAPLGVTAPARSPVGRAVGASGQARSRSASRISREQLGVGVDGLRVRLVREVPALGGLVRPDDEEVHDERHDEEADEGRQERPDGRPATRLPVVEGEVGAAGGLADGLEDDLGEGGDECREGGPDDERDGELDEVAAQDEVPEALHDHSFSEVGDGRCRGPALPGQPRADVAAGPPGVVPSDHGLRCRDVGGRPHPGAATTVTVNGPSSEPWPVRTASASVGVRARTTPLAGVRAEARPRRPAAGPPRAPWRAGRGQARLRRGTPGRRRRARGGPPTPGRR